MQFRWKYSSSIQQWKNFENLLRFEKVIGKSLVASFFWDTVYVQNKAKVTQMRLVLHELFDSQTFHA